MFIVTLSGTTVADIIGFSGEIFTDLEPILILILGTLIGTLVITFLIRTLHR